MRRVNSVSPRVPPSKGEIKVPEIPKDAGKDFKGKVIIIGSGVSGMMAGNVLKYLGVEDVVILEASKTWGGRVQRLDDFSDEVPLDSGAEWIHAQDAHCTADLLVFQEQRKEVENIEFINYHPQTWQFPGGRRDCQKHLYTSETKFKNTTWSQWLEACVYHHVKDQIKYNSPVKKIDYTGDGRVKVVLADGTVHEADKAICTIPLAVLKREGAVKFNPPLPSDKQKAIKGMSMPGGVKAFFEFKEKFYPDFATAKTYCQLIKSSDDEATFFDALLSKELSNKQHIMGVLITGTSAEPLANMTEDNLVAEILGMIDKLFDGQGSKNYVKHALKNYTKEPYIEGTYTFRSTAEQRAAMFKPVAGKIFFAGEHTSVDHYTTVHGAAISGRQAAVAAVSS